MLRAILLKLGLWGTDVGGHLHSKNHSVSKRKHRVTNAQKLCFFVFCQYTHGVAHRLFEPHDTLPCVLILIVLYLTIAQVHA